MEKKQIIHKSYKGDSPSTEPLIPQGDNVTFKFPQTFDIKNREYLRKHPTSLNTGCGCTNFMLNTERDEISFVIKSPTFAHLTQPYLKKVNPVFKSDDVIIKWDIQFWVKPN